MDRTSDSSKVQDHAVVVGGGVVGSATATALAHLGHSVKVFDIDPSRCADLKASGIDADTQVALGNHSSVILVAVPTPSLGTGYDMSYLMAALQSIGNAMKESPARHVVAIRSTVAPLTNESFVVPVLEQASGLSVGTGFAVGSAPEFLRQASALEDALHPRMTIVASRDSDARHRLERLFCGLGGEMRAFDDPKVAEMIKITHNCFNAAKITFFNEVHMLCEAVGIDSDVVSGVVVRSAEASFNPDYGRYGGKPFGGKCLPKDLDGLIGFAGEIGVRPVLHESIRTVNSQFANR